MGGMVHRVPGTMVTPMPGPGPNSDGVQSVTALPNPSFNQMGGANVTDQQPSLMQQNTSVNPHFNPASSQHQTHPSQPQMPPPTGAPQQPGVHPVAPNTQVPSPAPKQPPQAPSPHPMLMPSPSTPWNPSSPAHAPSPSQQPAHSEANSAVLTKLQELQPYVPLIARLVDRIEKEENDKTKNEQWVKLNSLYNVIQSKNIKVPLQTLEKCHTALEGLFNKKDPTSVSAPSPAMSNISAASPATNTSQIKTSNPPSIKAPPISPKAPVPPSPPITSPSRNLHDFSSLSSPRPLSSQLQAKFCPDEDLLDRLPPEKKAKLDEQGGMQPHMGGVGAGMMGYRPRMHPDPSYHYQQHPGMHMGGGGGPPPGMSMGMGGPPHPHMMNNTQGYPRIGMMPGNPMMSGPAHHPPMMAMGPPRPGMNTMYPGGRMPIGPTMGGMVHRVPGTMVTPMPGPGPNSGGVQSVTALPNPSFNQMGGANVTDQQSSLMQQNTSVNPNFNPASSQHQTHPSQPQMPPPTGAPQQPGVHPAALNTQVPSPAPKQPPQVPHAQLSASMNMAGMPQTDDWKNPERRQTVARRIAEGVQQFPEVLNRTPSEVEEAIYSKSDNNKESYVNLVGRVLLSIQNKSQQLMERGMQPYMGGVGAGMMGYWPRMHPDPSYHPQQHPGMYMGGGAGPPPDSSNVKSDPEDVKSRTETDSEEQPAQKIDYKPFLEKAAAEGTVKTRRTNLGLSGASGTGKTSTLRLLTDQEPEYNHHSTPVLQPMELFKDNSPHPEDEEEESSIDLDTNSDDSDKEQSEHEPVPTVRTTKHYMLIANKHKWTSATRDALFHRLANSVVELAHTPEKSNQEENSKCSIMKKGMFYPFRPLEQSASHSVDGPPSKKRKILTKSFDDLQAAREILAFIESHKDLKDLGVTHFVNVNDTGGQAAFIDIAPALMRYNSINLVLIKLDEPLNGKAQFFYSVRGKKVGTEKRQITTKGIVIAMFSSKMKIQKPQVEGLEYSENCGKPQFIVLGTHYDKYKQLKGQHEKLEMKNEELLECLRDFKDVLIANGDKVIFPLNTLARDEGSLKIAAKIRKLVTKCYVEAEVPTRWYILKVAINEIKGSKGNKDIIQFSKLLEIGSLIKIFEEELKAALQYFHDLTLCLYYPNVLPDVVFATPQCLFDKLSEIIAVSLGKCECGIDFEAKERLQNKGLFEKELLKQLPKGFVDDLFTPEDFLKLMEHLFIASHMPGTDTYFMPCVLETAENPLDNLPPSKVEPLLFTWNGSVPNGLFPSLIMSLKNYKTIAFEMAHHIKQYRNKITLSCPGLACLITLFEYPSFIGVTHNSNYTERSPKVHKSILNSMNCVVKRFDWTPSTAFPEEAYLCKMEECNIEYLHLCYSDIERLLLFCSESYSTDLQTEAYLAWYNKAGITNPSSSILQKKPLLKDAFSLLQEKSSKWDDIGRAFNVSLNDREELRTDTLLSNNARLERVLNVWLETSCHTPITWLEFRNILSDTLGFKDTARQVQTFLEKEQLNSTN